MENIAKFAKKARPKVRMVETTVNNPNFNVTTA